MTRRRRDRHNSELNSTYEANQQRLRSEQTCQRVHAVFTVSGKVKEKEYRQRWTADRDYKIIRVRAVCGNHVPHDDDDLNSHPNDGCPRGDLGIRVQVKKYDATYDDGTYYSGDNGYVKLFARDDRIVIAPGKHRDTAWASDVLDSSEDFLEDEFLTIKVSQIGDVYPGDGLVVTVVMEPA